jgi:hypothetical protein
MLAISMRGDEQACVTKSEPVMDGDKLTMKPHSMRIKHDGEWHEFKLRQPSAPR